MTISTLEPTSLLDPAPVPSPSVPVEIGCAQLTGSAQSGSSAAVAEGGIDLEAELTAFLACHRAPTASCYARDLHRFATHLRAEGRDVASVTPAVIARHIRCLERSGYKASSIARALSAISGLFDHLVAEGLLVSSPARGCRRPARPDGPCRLGLGAAELASLLDAAERSSDLAYGLVVLLGIVGLRCSEATSCAVQDLIDDACAVVLRVRRKDGREELVPLGGDVTGVLEALVDGREMGPLLADDDGHEISRHQAYRLVAALGERAGIARRVYPHLLRHGAASIALREGVPVPLVGAGLGHRDPATTLGYARRLAQESALMQTAISGAVREVRGAARL